MPMFDKFYQEPSEGANKLENVEMQTVATYSHPPWLPVKYWKMKWSKLDERR